MIAYYSRHKTIPVMVATQTPAPIKFLIHGGEYFPALSEALRSAEHMIFISGWWLAPEIRLRDGRADDTLISLLRDIVRPHPLTDRHLMVIGGGSEARVRTLCVYHMVCVLIFSSVWDWGR